MNSFAKACVFAKARVKNFGFFYVSNIFGETPEEVNNIILWLLDHSIAIR